MSFKPVVPELPLREFVPDRFVGGDDPKRTIQTLTRMHEGLTRTQRVIAEQNTMMLRLLGVLALQQAGVLRVSESDYKDFPNHTTVEINFREEPGTVVVRTIECKCEGIHDARENNSD
jgi:hypothetical protein